MAEEKRRPGRPLKFESAEDLQRQINAYFESCEEEIWIEEHDEDGQPTGDWKPVYDRNGEIRKRPIRPYTITGLAVHLETDRRTLLNYEEKEEYFHTIKAAKARIENYTEEILVTTKSAAGVIFNLKNNYGWQDKPDGDDRIKKLVSVLAPLNLTKEEIDLLLESL